ncbi:hypothetical protein ACGF07_01120 [Kitasatospora sp. NPDC048194]|uniref:hypothetical protein n=1 Tax=Kitasatospora sp. NPDC048194 TaxID=3364045 RepID=UPI003717B289
MSGTAARPSVDPVRELMADHRELCERAVDPLEIAAGLEEAGLGPDTAARCRHADLFSLAEELYARVPRRPPAAAEPAGPRPCRAATKAALAAVALATPPCVAVAALGPHWPVLLAAAVPLVLLPALTAPAPEDPGPPPTAPAAPADALGPAPARPPHARLRPDLRPGPAFRFRPAVLGHGLGLAALLLLPVAVPGGDRAPAAALVLAAAVSTGSAERAARWYRQVGRGHLGAARTLAEFRARMRPVLPVAVALHLAVLAVLTYAALAVLAAVAPRPGPGGGLLHQAVERAGAGQWAAQGVLGLLLVLPALLARCGRARAAALGALAGAAASAVPPALGRSGTSAVLLGGGAVAVVLLGYAWARLGRAGAHR